MRGFEPVWPWWLGQSQPEAADQVHTGRSSVKKWCTAMCTVTWGTLFCLTKNYLKEWSLVWMVMAKWMGFYRQIKLKCIIYNKLALYYEIGIQASFWYQSSKLVKYEFLMCHLIILWTFWHFVLHLSWYWTWPHPAYPHPSYLYSEWMHNDFHLLSISSD